MGGGDPGKVTLGFVPVSVEVSTSMISKNKGYRPSTGCVICIFVKLLDRFVLLRIMVQYYNLYTRLVQLISG